MPILTTTYDSATATTDLSCTIASLPTSATLITGRQTAVIDNSSNQYIDMQLMGQIMTGTSPTVNTTIALFAWSVIKRVAGASTYPRAGTTQLTATEAARTWVLDQLPPLIWSTNVNATSDTSYPINVRSVAQIFGGVLPQFFGFYLAHSTGVDLNSTAANQWLTVTGIKITST